MKSHVTRYIEATDAFSIDRMVRVRDERRRYGFLKIRCRGRCGGRIFSIKMIFAELVEMFDFDVCDGPNFTSNGADD